MAKRKSIPVDTRIQVLTESGYRCAVPTCRTILVTDLHHMVQVSDGGSNDASNLLPLCPNCHALYHREEIPQASIFAWKALIVSLNASLSISALEDLMFIASQTDETRFELSGDGVAKFSQLIGAGYVGWHGSSSEVRQIKPTLPKRKMNNFASLAQDLSEPRGIVFIPASYTIFLTAKGESLVHALRDGSLSKLYDPASPNHLQQE